jgi:hypothetical protein
VFAAQAVGVVGATAPLGGYALVTADDHAAATALAADCPAVVAGGGAEIGELTIVNGARPSDFARTLRVDARPEALFEALTVRGRSPSGPGLSVCASWSLRRRRDGVSVVCVEPDLQGTEVRP